MLDGNNPFTGQFIQQLALKVILFIIVLESQLAYLLLINGLCGMRHKLRLNPVWVTGTKP